MKTHVKLFIIVALGFSFFQNQFIYAQEPEEATPTITSSSAETEMTSFPYTAEIMGDNVYIRSGSGTNFYECSKLNKGDKVKVVGKVFSWSRIVPPKGSFSWIYMQYVNIDPENPTVGTVTGDNVRVYAGSNTNNRRPTFSTALQGKLKKGDKVKLLNEQMDDYYKIEPPPFAYLYVSSNFIKPVENTSPMPLLSPELPVTEMQSGQTATEPNETTAMIAVEKPVDTSPEAMLTKFNALQKEIETEQTKPLNERNYTEIKKALLEIANNKQAGKAARYAEYVAKQVEGYDLALAAGKEVKLQNEQLQKVKDEIDNAYNSKLADFEDLSKYGIVGELQPFATYGPGHYRIVDSSGKTLCYALPTGAISQMNLNNYVGKRVGLVGKIESRPQTPPGAMIQFTQIAELQ
jgi:uncharacterized protein YgiM (DUF1202 family)